MKPDNFRFPLSGSENDLVSSPASISSSLEDLGAAVVAKLLTFAATHPEAIPLAISVLGICLLTRISLSVSRNALDLHRRVEEPCDEGRSGKIVTRKTHPQGGEFEKSDRTPRRPPRRY